MTGDLGPVVVLGASVVAIGCAWSMARLARRERLLCIAALGVLSAISLYGLWDPVVKAERGAYPMGWESPEAAFAKHHVSVVAYDLDDYEPLTLYATQWFLPDTKFVLFHGDREVSPTRFYLSDARPRGSSTARPLWRWAGRDMVLWEAGLKHPHRVPAAGAGPRTLPATRSR